MQVLILGARAPACLEWARAFRAAGWRVSVGDSLRWPVARFTRAVDRYIRLPEPRPNPGHWIEALAQAVRDHGIDWVLPTCEESFYLAYGAKSIPAKVLVPNFDLMHALHHKGLFTQRVQGWAVQAPETETLSDPEQLAGFIQNHNPEDWVFKPAYSRFAHRTLIRPAPAAVMQLRPSSEQPWVAQRFVGGREYCSYSLIINGRVTAHACYHPRYRVGRGSGIWFEPVNPPAILAFVQRFAKETGYQGQVAFDFIESAEGTVYVVECNPRATSGVHLFDDQPQALVAALTDATRCLEPTPFPRQVALAMLLFAVHKHGFDRQFWGDLRRARDVITRPGDHGPLWAQIPGVLEIVGRALTRRCGLLAAATADSEWNGQDLGHPPCES